MNSVPPSLKLIVFLENIKIYHPGPSELGHQNGATHGSHLKETASLVRAIAESLHGKKEMYPARVLALVTHEYLFKDFTSSNV